MSGRRLALLIVGSIGGLFLLTGALLTFLGLTQAQNIEQAAKGTIIVRLSQLEDMSTTADILLEGRLAERNKLFDQGFVAFVISRYRGERCATPTPGNNYDDDSICKPLWVEETRETPPLWIELIDGQIELTNSDYQLQNPLSHWQSSEKLVKDQTLRSDGLEIGDPVLVKGTFVNRSGTARLKAEFVFGGDSQSYFDSQRRTNQVLFLLGAIFMGTGAIALVVVVIIHFAHSTKSLKSK